MAIALLGTLLDERIGDWALIVVGIAIGTAIGIPAARSVKMTAMPQMVALFNGVGGGAVALISLVEFREGRRHPARVADPDRLRGGDRLDLLLGLQRRLLQAAGARLGQAALPALHHAQPRRSPRSCSRWPWRSSPGRDAELLFWLLLVAAGVLGVTAVLPIGGADMPVVISTLNAFTGLSAAAAGIALDNTALIVAGMIVGASGSILTKQMAEAMNRSIGSVFFAGFGGAAGAVAAGDDGTDRTVRSTSAADVAIQLSYARLVVVVPGYGMAVAQAQRAVADLAAELERRGVEVLYAIHPVAGRMPGHMNVLLAEADVPYDKLKEMDDINGEFARTDVALIIGANDVTNPAARSVAGLADLRHADPRRRQGRLRRRAQALDGVRLRRHRQPALLRPEDDDAVRRRQGLGGRDHRRSPTALIFTPAPRSAR